MELIHEVDRSKWMVHSNHSTKRFTKGDIDKMTNNYRTSLGSGAFGEVYEGVLEDGSMVAVKRFIHNVKENFAKELVIHREINHKNVVRLTGYCVEENALMLVTKYIANGNLSDALHYDDSPFPLDVRLRIAIECAEALGYMHSQMYTHVIHGDIKPANILLDDNFHAKLTDFGISRLLNTDETLYTKNVIGSIGYMDPLFARDGLLTSKSDVYSFGVVLFELITRKKATTVVNSVNIVSAFTNALARGPRGAREIFDPDIANRDNMKIVEGVAKIAGECLILERVKRPNMIDVAERLRVLMKTLHQDQGQHRVDMFSWLRKSKQMPPAAVAIVPAKFPQSGLFRQFSLAEMKAATNDFHGSLLVGQGGFGRVYHGKINGGETNVAIRRCESSSMQYEHEFYNEIEKSSKLIHHNVLPLLGYCNDMDEMILVYSYMAHGCLGDHLYGTKHPPLTWNQRLEICIGAARGLHGLHSLQIIHGNVNTKKILLDEEWVVKIADLSSITGPSTGTTVLIGTPGYVDPEYFITCEFTEKSDVYSFGVVLFEVLCGLPVVCPTFPPEQRWLVGRALQSKEEGNLDQIIDPYLNGRINPWSLNKFAETAEK
ncbi:hypothetical protein HU200_034865 [Digitaria exilis]|uniref:Protein kinase domain-containing protein n=1 Tax=Digitaria exilis TaxID=1010633 RepID=A0A835BUA5_9POAL|nr:hypothetical protein HU200_034865 [Digitaria exilis]